MEVCDSGPVFFPYVQLHDTIWYWTCNLHMRVSSDGGTPKPSSISRWEIPWNKPSIFGGPHCYGKPQMFISWPHGFKDMQAMGVYNSCVTGWWSVRSSIYFPSQDSESASGKQCWAHSQAILQGENLNKMNLSFRNQTLIIERYWKSLQMKLLIRYNSIYTPCR